jgi:hypothetical protein
MEQAQTKGRSKVKRGPIMATVLDPLGGVINMEPYIQRWVQRAKTPAACMIIPLAIVLAAAVAFTFFAGYLRVDTTVGRGSAGTMIILRGIANSENPRGQLDDESALEYARRVGYEGEVLDVAGDNSAQVRIALDRIRGDEKVTAIYGFSGGGYNAKRIWGELKATERERIGKIVVIGAPGVGKADFPGHAEVLIKQDPPAGHMAGPKALLESLEPS